MVPLTLRKDLGGWWSSSSGRSSAVLRMRYNCAKVLAGCCVKVIQTYNPSSWEVETGRSQVHS
jgi:hypothetical protein